jgi:2-desacetyl-2-hydroxyethyl bacteriochlorophyllide A dehydrogenase
MNLRRTVYFTAPRQIEIRTESLAAPADGEVLVETICSAISAGTEMLVYRGQFARGLADAHDALSSRIDYPVAYGYACVGAVKETGKHVDPAWRDKLVFAFQPHTTHFVLPAAALIPLPENISPKTACFLPNMETAVNLIQDAAPIIGERVMVFGQGIVGLLTTALLMEFPLAARLVADRYPLRRAAALALGVTAAFDPEADGFHDEARILLERGADLSFELSGHPAALNDALALTGFSGRVVVGSWYGEKQAALNLGGAFHRSRIKLISSQVSTIAPELGARWDKARRFGVAWDALQRIQPQRWITQRFPIEQAADAYRLLDEHPQETIQILLSYQE